MNTSVASPPIPVSQGETSPGVEPEPVVWQRGWVRVAIAAVLAGEGMAFGLAANLTPPSGATYWLLHGALAASAAIVFALLGFPLLRECVAALRAGRVTVDLLFLLALSGVLGVSLFSTLRREGPVFYELVAILLAIYTVGKLLGARSRSRALQAVQRLRAGHDQCRLLQADGTTRSASAADVVCGDRVRVLPGELVPVDGVLTAGEALVWTTPLTGEPDPLVKSSGAVLLAGMRVLDAPVTIEVTAPGGHRRLDGILREIERARLRPSQLQVMADRLARRFIPLVLAASLGTFAFWFWRSGVGPAVINGLAVLVVACPCALGLATPLGVWAGLVHLGRLGLVARTGDFLDALATADTAVLDKTGTLSESELSVRRVDILGTAPVGADDVRALLAAAEAVSGHPVARAICAGLPPDPPKDAVNEVVTTCVRPARGIAVEVRRGRDGRLFRLLAGTRALLEEEGVTGLPAAEADETAEPGLRTILVAIDGLAAARICLQEQARRASEPLLGALRELGLEVEILTGDPAFPPSTWPGVPRQVGIGPEAKAARIRELQQAGRRVLFAGDGINDAPALAQADASIAIRQGAELARTNAMAVIGGAELGTLAAAIRLARTVRRAIRSNIVFAAAYNTVGMAIAAVGWLHPVLAALLMASSSAIVSTRVLRAAGGADATLARQDSREEVGPPAVLAGARSSASPQDSRLLA